MKGVFPCVRAVALGAMGVGFLLFASVPGRAALLPPLFVNSVVAIGAVVPVVEPGQALRLEWKTVGTGFLYGYRVKNDPDVSQRRYEVYLVTARHVVQPFLMRNQDLSVRLNPTDATSNVREFAVVSRPPEGAETWFCHPVANVDVASVAINFNVVKEQGLEQAFVANDLHIAKREELSDLGVAAGDGVFVLGFPMGLSGIQRNYVIVRQGAIARLSEMLDHMSPSFLIDALVFPGNSGGPVVLRPDITSIVGTKSQPAAYVIGIVIAYRPYVDRAMSEQTNRPRVLFEENSGLAEVLPIDVAEEAIRAHRGLRGIVEGPSCLIQ
jgi:hypothetical protein